MRQAPQFWEKRGIIAKLLWPLSLIFAWLTAIRKYLYELNIFNSKALTVPLIIVGNLRVGGTGKTPTVLALAKALHMKGFHPGIISRGYEGQLQGVQEVSSASSPKDLGDEPCYMAQQLDQFNIPIFVCRDRTKTAKALLKAYPQVNVIISDDGLQHYALKRWPAREGGRDIELVVRDARAEGNGYLLPAGPLRELANRSRDYTLSITSSSARDSKLNLNLDSKAPYIADAPNFSVTIRVKAAYQLFHPSNTMTLSELQQKNDLKVLATAGLGNPQKFFDLLSAHGLVFEALPLPDHYDFLDNPLNSKNADIIIMTEKDAVKCSQLDAYKNDERIWVLPIEIELPKDLIEMMVEVIQRPQPSSFD
jgi:tetraacyldisaccharide 4'-kinase